MTIRDTLIDLLEAHMDSDLAATADAILDTFDVRAKAAPKKERAKPEVGQTWRNKQSDRLVKITRIDRGYNQAVNWEALTGRGPRTGRSWPHYWTDRFEFVEEAAE